MRTLARGALAAALVALAAAAQDPPRDPAAQEQGQPYPAYVPVAVVNPFQPFDRARFDAACRELGATDAQLQAFTARAEELGLARAADDMVRELVPAFAAASKQYEDGDPGAALALAKLLPDGKGSLLGAHVRYRLARLFLDSDDPERAIGILNEYLERDINRSPLDAEAAFFYATALADLPMPEQAEPRLRAFLQWFPDASERYRSAASQRLGEIERQQQSRLHDLANGMQKTARDLKKQRTGKPVQVDQERYLTELQKLIEEFQERESQGGGPPSGTGAPSGPAQNSALVEGEGTVGELRHRPSLADRWGDMKDADREKIAAEVGKALPPQYQKMLEEYYKRLGKAGTRR
jgi:hypothetical protein